MEKNLFIDKIQGMLLAAAYGDALGAPHEMDGLSGKVIDPQKIAKLCLGCDFYHDEKMNQWSVWPPPSMVDQRCGIPTDDTAYRLTIFHEYLRQCLKDEVGFTETGYRSWMSSALDLHRDSHSDWYIDCRNAQIKQWQEMFAAEPESREAVFYLPGLPIVFGLFLYLELATIFPNKPSSLVYTIFRRLTRLDQSTAGIITGLCAMITAAAMKQDNPERGFGDWLTDNVIDFMRTAKDITADDDDRDFLKLLKGHTKDMIALGRRCRGGSELAFVEALKAEAYDHSDWFNPRLKNFDPMLFWMQMIAASSFSPADPVAAIRVLAGSAGDADTVPTMLGTMIGAYYGLQPMLGMTSAGISFGEELMEVRGCLEDLFEITVEGEAQLFWEYWRMLNPEVD